MEHIKCEYQNCDNTFAASPPQKRFCCRNCKVKNMKKKKYDNDFEYREYSKDKALKGYYIKKSNYTQPAFLSEEQIETLKKIRPDWF